MYSFWHETYCKLYNCMIIRNGKSGKITAEMILISLANKKDLSDSNSCSTVESYGKARFRHNAKPINGTLWHLESNCNRNLAEHIFDCEVVRQCNHIGTRKSSSCSTEAEHKYSYSAAVLQGAIKQMYTEYALKNYKGCGTQCGAQPCY